MNKKSVIFIEPAGSKVSVFDNFMRLPLLGSLYLGTILHNEGYQVRILNENILGREVDPFETEADVFCITALTVSANRARILAHQIKSIHPESMVVIGGIHASLLPEDFTDIADHVVTGEAEEIIVDVVEGKFRDKIIHGPKTKDLEKLPLVNYGLLEKAQNIRVVPVMTSRGCPFDCTFCTVTKVFGRKFRMQSPQRIVAEVENALAFFGGKTFFFYDDNFSANKKRVHELCDLMIEKKLGITWVAQVRSDLAKDPELVNRMVAAGLDWVFVGFESIEDETLKAYNKSQTRADIEDAIRVLHAHKVSIHGMFMFGEDHDTVETMANTVDFAIKNEIETVQFMILTPFPGTQCYDRIVEDNRLLHRDWDYFNAMFTVFRPKNMSAARLLNETHRAYRKFYSLRRTLLDMLFMVFNVLLDGMVWNFKRADKYSLDAIFLRGGAKSLVKKHSPLYEAYLKYLNDIEKKNVLNPQTSEKA